MPDEPENQPEPQPEPPQESPPPEEDPPPGPDREVYRGLPPSREREERRESQKKGLKAQQPESDLHSPGL
jgi:hypothetical protein